MQTILVPIDFSKESIEGLRIAIDVAHQTNGEIIMLHNKSAFDFDQKTNEMSEFAIENQQNLMDSDDKFVDELEKLRGLRIQYHVPRMKINFMVTERLSHEKLYKFINKEQIDLIVLGKSHQKQSSTFLLEKLVVNNSYGEQRYVPILAVNKYVPRLRYRKILVYVDPQKSDLQFLKLISQLADLLCMEVYFTKQKVRGKRKEKIIDQKTQIYIDQVVKKNNYHIMSDFPESNDPNLSKKINELGVDLLALTRIDSWFNSDINTPNTPRIEKSKQELATDFV